jgi:hypothetical protein
VGYEYHAGVFVPCAPFGTGNNNGYFMEVCETCATPRSSGIPIKGGIRCENLNEEVTPSKIGGADITLLWSNANASADFAPQTVALASDDFTFLLIETVGTTDTTVPYGGGRAVSLVKKSDYYTNNDYTDGGYIEGTIFDDADTRKPYFKIWRYVKCFGANVTFYEAYFMNAEIYGNDKPGVNNEYCIPTKIYGVKL